MIGKVCNLYGAGIYHALLAVDNPHDGLITTRRGTISVVDRAGLERAACECHDRVEGFFADMIGEGGLGRPS